MYTVKQVAEIMGISVHTLRFYDKEGLFPWLSRDGNNVRLFTDRDLERVYLVQCMRETGMPLAEIKEYIHLCSLGDPTIVKRYEMIQSQVQRAEQELVAMAKRIRTLKNKVEYYNGLLTRPMEDFCNPMNPALDQEELDLAPQPAVGALDR